jgi:hypothetical protein
MPESVFAKTSQDEATGAGRGRALDTLRGFADERVIYRSNFDVGADGWIDHWDGFRPWPPLSLTDAVSFRGRRSMMLSTGEHASPVAGDPSDICAAFRRMALHDDYRYHHYSAYLAIGVGGFSATWANVQLMIDTQDADNGSRSFYKLSLSLHPGGPSSGFRWKIRDDSVAGEDNMITVTEADGGTFPGNNDNKWNWQYVRLTIDRAANGGLGGYHSFQTGPDVFDLSGLGAGHANEPPQVGSPVSYIADFRRGFNIGALITRDTSLAGGAQLFIDDVVYSVSNTVA